MSAFDLSILHEFLLRQIVRKFSFRSGPKFYRTCRGAKEFVDGVNPDWLPPESSRYHIIFRADWSGESLVLLDVQTFNSKPLSIAMPYKARFMGGAFLNGELYVFGGYVFGDSSTDVAYKLKENWEWEQLPDMNEKRAGIAESCVVYKGCIWVMGGFDKQGPMQAVKTRTVEAYDPTSNSWITKPPMNYGRVRSSAAVVHGKIFVCGGCDEREPSTVEYFDDQLSRWIDCSPLPVRLWRMTALVLGSNLVIAGWNGRTSDVWSLDVGEANPRWTNMSSTTRLQIRLGTMFGGKLVAIGNGGGRGSAEIFDGRTWRLGTDLPECCQNGLFTSISGEMARNLRENQEQLDLVAQADASLNLGN